MAYLRISSNVRNPSFRSFRFAEVHPLNASVKPAWSYLKSSTFMRSVLLNAEGPLKKKMKRKTQTEWILSARSFQTKARLVQYAAFAK